MLRLQRTWMLLTIVLIFAFGLLTLLSCGPSGGASSSLNEVLSGMTQPSSSSSQEGSLQLLTDAVAFRDLSNDPEATYLDPDSDFLNSDDDVDNDDGAAEITLPFNFEMFGVDFPAGTTVYIDTNGFIAFEANPEKTFNYYGTYENIGLAYQLHLTYDNESGVTAIIAPFWDDLKLFKETIPIAGVYCKLIDNRKPVQPGSGSGSGNRRFVIQWIATDYIHEDNFLTFQVILFEGTNDIEFTYGYMKDTNNDDWNEEDQFWDEGSANGLSSTIGIGAVDRESFLSYSMKVAYMYQYFSEQDAYIGIGQEGRVIYFKYDPVNCSYNIYEGTLEPEDLPEYTVPTVIPDSNPNPPKIYHSSQPYSYSHLEGSQQ